METFSAIASIVLSVISVGIAIFAIFQTNRQIKLSNKQHLFDRRIKNYIFLKELIALFSDNYKEFEKEWLLKIPSYCLDMLVNCTELSVMAPPIKFKNNLEFSTNFVSKCEMFENIATEIELIWSIEEAKTASKFVRQYKEFLLELYRRHYWLQELKNGNSDKAKNKLDNEDVFIQFGEITETYNKIVETNVMVKLSKSIRL